MADPRDLPDVEDLRRPLPEGPEGPGGDHPPCRRLFWNARLLGLEPDAALRDPSADFVWCSHSMNCLGPDGKVASRRACRPGRRCWEG